MCVCVCVPVSMCQGELKGSKLYNKLLEDAQHYYKSTVVSSTLVFLIAWLGSVVVRASDL